MTYLEKLKRAYDIISIVKSNDYPSLKFIHEKISRKLEIRGLSAVSEKTIHRDINSVKDILEIKIKYTKKMDGYYIEQIFDSKIENFLNSFQLLYTFKEEDIPSFIIPENRKLSSIIPFFEIKNAIEEKKKIQFFYQKFDEDIYTQYTVEPYALKQSRNRWYVLGTKEEDKSSPRAFALDRINGLTMTETKCSYGNVFDWNDLYKDCFAMFNPPEEPQKIVLSFDKRDGHYIETLPIHSSQILRKEKDRVIVELYMKISLDFIMELMSRAWSVEVIEPQSLRKKLHDIFNDAAKRNK